MPTTPTNHTHRRAHHIRLGAIAGVALLACIIALAFFGRPMSARTTITTASQTMAGLGSVMGSGSISAKYTRDRATDQLSATIATTHHRLTETIGAMTITLDGAMSEQNETRVRGRIGSAATAVGTIETRLTPDGLFVRGERIDTLGTPPTMWRDVARGLKTWRQLPTAWADAVTARSSAVSLGTLLVDTLPFTARVGQTSGTTMRVEATLDPTALRHLARAGDIAIDETTSVSGSVSFDIQPETLLITREHVRLHLGDTLLAEEVLTFSGFDRAPPISTPKDATAWEPQIFENVR